jgi:arginase family enzyme
VTDTRVIEDDPAYPPAEIRTAFELARRLAIAVRSARTAGHFPLVLSGNCNTAVGTLSGLTPARRATFWFDAHGDCNTPETTASGFLDGMGLAMAAGLCWHELTALVPGYEPVAPSATFLLGARDLDRAEAAVLERSAIATIPVQRIPEALPSLFAQLTGAIAAIRARVLLGAAALTSYSPEHDHDQGVCKAAFAAIDAIVA